MTSSDFHRCEFRSAASSLDRWITNPLVSIAFRLESDCKRGLLFRLWHWLIGFPPNTWFVLMRRPVSDWALGLTIRSILRGCVYLFEAELCQRGCILPFRLRGPVSREGSFLLSFLAVLSSVFQTPISDNLTARASQFAPMMTRVATTVTIHARWISKREIVRQHKIKCSNDRSVE